VFAEPGVRQANWTDLAVATYTAPIFCHLSPDRLKEQLANN
jgi:hypothetical protein